MKKEMFICGMQQRKKEKSVLTRHPCPHRLFLTDTGVVTTPSHQHFYHRRYVLSPGVFVFLRGGVCIRDRRTEPFCRRLDRFQVHYSANSPGKARRSTSFKRKGCPAAEAGSRSRRRTTDVGRAHDRGMANKENELTCSGEVRGNCGASKMAEAGSKYSDFTEVRVAPQNCRLCLIFFI